MKPGTKVILIQTLRTYQGIVAGATGVVSERQSSIVGCVFVKFGRTKNERVVYATDLMVKPRTKRQPMTDTRVAELVAAAIKVEVDKLNSIIASQAKTIESLKNCLSSEVVTKDNLCDILRNPSLRGD